VPSVPPISDSPPALEDALLLLELPLLDVLLVDVAPVLLVLDVLLVLLVLDEPPSPLLLDEDDAAVVVLVDEPPPAPANVRLGAEHETTPTPSAMQMPSASARGLATECLSRSMERLPVRT
jgi:hypothetical protein